MIFDLPTTYTAANSASDATSNFNKIARDIITTAKGGSHLNPVDYLLIRDNEDKAVTAKRVEKFAPKNYLGAAIRLQKVKQSSGQLDIHSDSLPGDATRWGKFLKSVNCYGDSLPEFVLNTFEDVLIQKKSYVLVELPNFDLDDNINQAQLESLNLQNITPKLVPIPLLNILACKEDGDGVNWIKYKELETVENPLKGTTYNLNIYLIDSEHITMWSWVDVKVNCDGNPVSIFDPTLKRGKGGYKQFNPDKNTAIPVSVPHNRDICPVVKFELSDSKWMADQCFHAQKIIYGQYMNLIHSAVNAGFVQKWGKPVAGKPNSVTPVPKSISAQEVAQNMDDDSFMFLEQFQFAEIGGSSIDAQMKVLDDLRDFIFQMISGNTSYLMSKGVIEQSGKAKEVDLHLQALTLKDHGLEILQFTTRILQHTARAFGVTSQELLDAIACSGMNRFNSQLLGDSLDTLERILKLPPEVLTSEILKEAYQQLYSILAENNDYSEKAIALDAIATKSELFVKSTMEFI